MFRFSDMFSLSRICGPIMRNRGRIEKMIKIYGAESYRWYVKVFSCPDTMQKTLGVNIPPWVKALSFRNCVCFLEQSYWLEPEPNGYDNLLVHECAHCLANARYGKGIPRWLDEGLAMYFAGQIGSTEGIGMPPQEKDIACIGYEDPMLYRYSSLLMDALTSVRSIGGILALADDAENFSAHGPLGDKTLRESITAFKEK